ncbi:MAG: hypothetical protein NTW08_00270 [Gammaproteobacteria bacterium]|nr:hypothetical protein [Gammaproteobacteria bacterium]
MHKHNNFKPFHLIFLLFLTIMNAYSAQNPISWSLSGSFPNPVTTGINNRVTYTLKNQLPFQLVHPLFIEKQASPASEFTYIDTCTGQRLRPQQTCTVQITLTPFIIGAKEIQIIIAGYDRNKVPLPLLFTTSTSSTGAVDILPATPTPLNSPLNVGESSPYEFTFTNRGTEDATGVSAVSTAAGYTSTCGPTLAKAGGHCTVSGTFTPVSATPSSQSVTATLSYHQGAPISVTSSTSVTSPTASVTGATTTPLTSPLAVGTPSNYT